MSPDAALHLVSLATLLLPDNRFLAEKYRVRYVASGRDLLRTLTPGRTRRLVLVGAPQFDAVVASSTPGQLRGLYVADAEHVKVPDLPGTLRECQQIQALAMSQHWAVSMLTGLQASEAAVKHLHAPTILHMATHGFYLPERKGFINPMVRSGLALAGAARTLLAWGRGQIPDTFNDGILLAAEVGTLDLHGTSLVTLSACDTGTGQVQAGEGILGLKRAFVQAGTQNLLVTLWPVVDIETASMMHDFYRMVLGGAPPAQALWDVQTRWLVRLRRARGLSAAVSMAGPFIVTSQGPIQH